MIRFLRRVLVDVLIGLLKQDRRHAIDVLIELLERDIYETPIKKVLDEEKREVMFRNLWEHPYFREYCIERETRMVHMLAKTDDPNVRGNVKGQRVENMLWFDRARTAHEKHQKERREKELQEDGSSSKRSA